MQLEKLPYDLTVCKLRTVRDIDLDREFFFVGRTDKEISLVCRSEDVPENTVEREDGWNGFRVSGVLDFSLIGILAKLSGILAENGIGIFSISTFNTDYVLIKAEDFKRAMRLLAQAGYTVL